MAQTSKDAIRVLQGLRLVLQQMAARGTPAAAAHIQSAVTHATDLAQSLSALSCQLVKEFPSRGSAQPSMEEILRAMQQQQQPQSPQSGASASQPQAPATPADIEAVKATASVDPLGWSKVTPPSDGLTAAHNAMPNVRETAVPSSQLSRMLGFGSLAARMALGAASEKLLFSSSDQSRVSQRNAERLSETLCKMRGAALKLGQMLSISDEVR